MGLERVVIVFASGVFIGFIGYMIRERNVMWCIAGYDSAVVHDAEGLAKFIGTRLYLVAILTFGVGISEWYGSNTGWIVYSIAVIVVSVWMVHGSSRYTQ